MDDIMDTLRGRDEDDDERGGGRLRNEPVQSDREYEDPVVFPPDVDADTSIGGSPEEAGVLGDEQSR